MCDDMQLRGYWILLGYYSTANPTVSVHKTDVKVNFYHFFFCQSLAQKQKSKSSDAPLLKTPRCSNQPLHGPRPTQVEQPAAMWVSTSSWFCTQTNRFCSQEPLWKWEADPASSVAEPHKDGHCSASARQPAQGVLAMAKKEQQTKLVEGLMLSSQ